MKNIINKPAASKWKLVEDEQPNKDCEYILILFKEPVRSSDKQNDYTLNDALVSWSCLISYSGERGFEGTWGWCDNHRHKYNEKDIVAWAEVNFIRDYEE